MGRKELLKNIENDGNLIKIEKIKAVTYCEACQKEYPTIQYGKVCPYCNSERTYLIKGNELIIKEIEAVEV